MEDEYIKNLNDIEQLITSIVFKDNSNLSSKGNNEYLVLMMKFYRIMAVIDSNNNFISAKLIYLILNDDFTWKINEIRFKELSYDEKYKLVNYIIRLYSLKQFKSKAEEKVVGNNINKYDITFSNEFLNSNIYIKAMLKNKIDEEED